MSGPLSAVERLVEQLTAEGLLTMAQIARMYPSGSHKSTAVRHATRGIVVRGQRLKLEAILVGGRLCTSKAALMRFFAAMNQEPPPMVVPRSFAKRQRDVAKAREELDVLLGLKRGGKR